MATILLIEQDRYSREGLRDSLEGVGHAVETAADASQAIAKIQGRSFEVGIIDLDLPAVQGVRMCGWDLARNFRARNPGGSLILVSALEERGMKAQAAQLQASTLLEKPISPSHLKGLLRRLNHETAHTTQAPRTEALAPKAFDAGMSAT